MAPAAPLAGLARRLRKEAYIVVTSFFISDMYVSTFDLVTNNTPVSVTLGSVFPFEASRSAST